MGRDYKPIRQAPRLSGNPPEVIGEGRRCTECGAKLNRYHKSDTCHSCKRKHGIDGGPSSSAQVNRK